jgi:hypothetical protein
VCVCVGNHRSRGVVIVRLRSSARSLLHQRRDLHQLIYLYLSEDQKPTSHQVVNDEIMNIFVASGVYIEKSPWSPPFVMMGRQGFVAVTLKITLSRGQLKCKKGRMMRTCLSWIHPHPHGLIPRHF